MTEPSETPIAPAAAAPPRHKPSALGTLKALGRPKIAVMLALGYASGLPFLLIGNTLNYWLGDMHVDLAVIGFASWIGLAYSFKFIFGGAVDNLDVPLLGRLGRRRGWMLATQLVVAIGLLLMATCNPTVSLSTLVAFGLITALGAATQDTVIDAWRIESAVDSAELDLLTSAYSLGYRVSNVLTGSVILFMASGIGWPAAYAVFGLSMAIGIGATLLAQEPALADAVMKDRNREAPGFSLRRVRDVVIGPFVSFFRSFGWMAALILLTVTAYHLSDYMRGPVINPFYVEVGLSKDVVAAVRLTVGLPTAILGIAAGGLFAARFGHMRALIVGTIIQPIAVVSFAVLAWTGPDVRVFSAVMALDDFSMTFAGVALTVYMSTLTSLGYTATQYALLTSALVWAGKTLKGFSGTWVKDLNQGPVDLVHAYATYFGYAAVTGIPAFFLVVMLIITVRRRQAAGLATGRAGRAPGEPAGSVTV